MKEKIFVPSGWDTTDEDEINRRRQRALKENIKIIELEPKIEFFGTYKATAESKNVYIVEIRSLEGRINSCTCTDYLTNELGICKHIEKTILHLEKKGKAKYQEASKSVSPRVEIYVSPDGNKVMIGYPKKQNKEIEYIRSLLNDFFSEGRSLISDPSISLPVIRRIISEVSDKHKEYIRFSMLLNELENRTKLQSTNLKEKESFLADVSENKRSLDIMKLPLYEYQQQGMLHLAFTGRAILADEMGLGKTVQAVAACELLRKLDKIIFTLQNNYATIERWKKFMI